MGQTWDNMRTTIFSKWHKMPFYQSLVMECYLHDSGLVGIWPSTVTELAPFVVARSIREVLVHDKYMSGLCEAISHPIMDCKLCTFHEAPLCKESKYTLKSYTYTYDLFRLQTFSWPHNVFLEEVEPSVASSQSRICSSFSRRFGTGRN